MSPQENKSVFHNTLYLTVAYIAQKVLTLAYNVVIARVYMPGNQGRYNTALAFTSLFSVVIDLGLASVLTREVAQNKEQASKYYSQVLIMRVALGVIIYGTMIGVAYLSHYPSEVVQMIMLTGIATFFDVICTSCWAVWRGLHNLRYEAIGAILATSVMVICGGVAMYLHLPIIYLAASLVASSGIGLLYGLFLIIKKSGVKLMPKPDFGLMKALLLLTVPFGLAAVFSRVCTFMDVVIVGKVAGDNAAGWYSTANKIILALQFLPGALAASTYPAMSSLHIQEDGVAKISQIFFRASRYLLVLVIPMSAGLALLARQIVLALPGEAYLPMVPMLQILSISLVFAFMIFPLGSLIAAIHRQSLNTAALALGAVICVAGNLLLDSHLGGVGASIVACFTYGSIFFIEMVAVRKYWLPLIGEYSKVISKIALAAAVMSGMLWLIRDDVNLLISVLLGIVVYGAIAVLTNLVSWQEVMQFLRRTTPPITETTS